MMSDSSFIKMSRPQFEINAVNARIMYAVWARNSGKTAMIAIRVLRLSEVMPRAQVLLYSDTFERLQDVIVPGILQFLENELGIVEGEDYVKFKKPPEHWTKPLTPLEKFDKVISFRSGFCLCLASQKVSGSANGYNAYALVVDETKFIKEEKINTEVLPAIRGNIRGKKLFGHLPEYCSKWYFTDKWGQEIKWILRKKKLMNSQRVKAVLTLQKEILRLEKESEKFTGIATKYKYKHQIETLTKACDKIRCKLVHYSDAPPYANEMIAGKQYFREQKRDLSSLEYSVAIENKNPDVVPNVFYPSFNKETNCYKGIEDVNPLFPLLVSMDYQWRITPMTVAQVDRLPGSEYTTLNFICGIHTLHPNGGIKQTVKKFCERFANHVCKEVQFYFDHTAVADNPIGKSFYETAIDEFEANGWTVTEQYYGKAPKHHDRYNKFIDYFAHTGDMAIKFNEEECEYLIKAIQQAGTLTVNKETKKDKTKEKNLNYPAEESTDYTEAMDMIIWGVIERKLYTHHKNALGGFYVPGMG